MTPTAATIFHRTGVTTVPLENLSKELQERFGYSKERAETYKDLEPVKGYITDSWIRDDYAGAVRLKSGELHISSSRHQWPN